MKKGNKALAVLLIGMIGMSNVVPEILIKDNIIDGVRAYEHKPDNILDNVFEKDGVTFLPFIFESTNQRLQKEYLIEQFQKAGITIQNEDELKSTIATGTKIKTEAKTYTVLIYGDVDADGCTDSFDALEIVEHVVYGGEKEIKGIYKTTANVENDTEELDSFDALRIVEFVVGKQPKLVLNEPDSFKQANIQITLVGDNPQIIKLGTPYAELGASAIDKEGKELNVTKDASAVDVNKVGEYDVIYKAVDDKGNEAKKIRKVQVVDYVTGIQASTTKQDYEYGEKLNMDAITVEAVMKSGDNKVVNANEYEISGYDANKEGEQTLKVTYNTNQTIDDKYVTFETSFKVNVKKGERITLIGDNPQIIKLGQPYVELGATAKDDQGNEIEVTKDASAVNVNKVGEYDVVYTIIDEQGNEIRNVRKVKVVDYVTGIQASTTKTDYNYAEELDLNTITVQATMKSNEKKVLELNSYKVTGYDANKEGKQTLKVTYTTNDTIDDKEKEFEAELIVNVLKQGPIVTVTQSSKTSGYCNVEWEIATVTATPAIQKDELTWKILDADKSTQANEVVITDENIAKVTTEQKQANGPITMRFVASKKGNYKIIPIVAESEKTAIPVKVLDNPTVNEIVMENISVNKNGIKRALVEFLNGSAIDVTIDRIKLELNGQELVIANNGETQIVEGIKLTMLGEGNQPLDSQHSSMAVKAIMVEATEDAKETGSTTPNKLKVTVLDEATKTNVEATVTKDITVLKELAPQLNINKGLIDASDTIEHTSVTLYQEKVNRQDVIVKTEIEEDEDENGDPIQVSVDYMYTLVPVYLKYENNSTKKILASDLTDKNLKVTEGVSELLPYIKVLGFKEGSSTPVTGDNPIDYVGIALTNPSNNEQANKLRNTNITITYGSSTKQLQVNIPEKQEPTITVTQSQKTTEYCNIEWEVATITASPAISKDDLTWKIVDVDNSTQTNEVIITDAAIAKVTIEQTNSNSPITMKFIATRSGNYKIVPIVAGNNKTAISVRVIDNPAVSTITLEDVSVNRNGIKTVPITFSNGKAVDVTMDRIKLEIAGKELNVTSTGETQTVEGIKLTILGEGNQPIDIQHSNMAVKAIMVEATEDAVETGSTTPKKLKVTVLDEATKTNIEATTTKNITVLKELAPQLNINKGLIDALDTVELTQVTLYQDKVNRQDVIVKTETEEDEDENGNPIQVSVDYMYTLVPVYLKYENNSTKKILASDLTDKNLKVTEGASEILPYIKVLGFKEGSSTPVTGDNPIDYVGIALTNPNNNEQANKLRNTNITITYGTSTKQLKVNIPEKQEPNPVVSQIIIEDISVNKNGLKTVPIDFYNDSSVDVEIDRIKLELEGTQLSINNLGETQTVQGIKLTMLGQGNQPLDSTHSSMPIKAIMVEATDTAIETGSGVAKKLKITVLDEATKTNPEATTTNNITILKELAPELNINKALLDASDTAEQKTITLYQNKVTRPDVIIKSELEEDEDENGDPIEVSVDYMYTLVPVYLKYENKSTKKLLASDLTSKNLKVTEEASSILPYIKVLGFKQGSNEPVTGDNPIDYIGIALTNPSNDSQANSLRDTDITITYGTSVKKLRISI